MKLLSRASATSALKVGLTIAAFGMAGSALADPITTIPSDSDFAIKFVDREVQITALGQELFGIFNVTTITNQAGDTTFWSGNGVTDGMQLVGVFENLTSIADQTGGTGLSFSGGNGALYLVPNGTYSQTTSPNTKDFLNQVCGGDATCIANPWLTFDFVSGINDAIGEDATIQAAFATTNVQAGFGYMSVTGGTNAAFFDTNGFTFNNFGPADLSFRSNFVLVGGQNCTTTQSGGWGVCSDDPVTGATASVPEPGTLALAGLGLLAAGMRRRKNSEVA